jgi:CIC family chloride channel protein
MFWTEGLFDRLRKLPRWLRPALGGLAVGIVLIWLPSIAGYTYAVNNQAILGQADPIVLLAILLLKPVVVGLTLGSGGSGGVFAPALKAGAAFGAIAGMLLHLAFPELTGSSGAYALVGMGAIVAGTMHAPLTAILMIFEVSDTYEVILPIMFAAVSSAVVSRLLMKNSIYTVPLERQGIEIGYGINISIVHRVTVEEIMRRAIVRIRRSTSIRDLVRLVEETDQAVFPVVTEGGTFLGVVRFQDLRTVLRSPDIHSTLIAEDIMVKNTPMLSPSDALDMTLKTFELGDFDMLPVIDPTSREVIGMVDHEDALRRYRKEILLHSAK